MNVATTCYCINHKNLQSNHAILGFTHTVKQLYAFKDEKTSRNTKS